MVSVVNSQIVQELTQRYQHTRNCLVVEYRGMKAPEVNELRKDLGEKKLRMEVIKNTLAFLAFKEIGLDDMGKLLEGPSALISGAVDSVVLAKTVVEWSKKLPALKIKGGMVEGRIVSIPEVEMLSRLPSRPALYTQLVTLLKSPLGLLATVLNAPLQNFRGAMEALKTKKEKEGTSNTGG